MSGDDVNNGLSFTEEGMDDIEEVVPAAEASGDERLAYQGLGQRLLLRPEIVGVLFAVFLYLFFWGATRPFGNAGGLATVLDVSATLGIMAVAVGALMIGGEFDLSAGAMTGAMGIIIILLVKETGELGGAGLNYWIALPLSLVIALGIGWLNANMVERTALPSFIVTLATFFVLRGLKLAGSKITVDQIQVGRADEGAGFEFWRKIMGSVWIRGDHPWESRDLVYTVATTIGGVLLAGAVCLFAFRRREKLNPAGVPVLLAGLVGIGVGAWLTHSLDGSDWIPMVVIAVSGVVAAFGLGLWRLAPLSALAPKLPTGVLAPLAGSLALCGAAIGSALAFDADNEEDLFFPVTEQGLRGLLFIVFAALAAGLATMAVSRARATSPGTRALATMVVGLTIFGMALFVQSQSESPKFRTQLFAILSLAALAALVWSVMVSRFEARSAPDRDADRTARIVAGLGLAAVLIGVAVRVLFSVEAEIAAEDPSRLAKFSIRVVWFVGFTLLMSWVLRSTKFGSWTYAVGGNKQAARQIGVPAARVKTQLFMLVAFAAWLVGMLLAFRLNTIQAGTGNFEEFEYIIAAVVGGTLLTGGYGSAQGAATGALLMAMAQQGISFAGWNTDWRFFFLGIILLVAVYANGAVRRRAEAIR